MLPLGLGINRPIQYHGLLVYLPMWMYQTIKQATSQPNKQELTCINFMTQTTTQSVDQIILKNELITK